MKFVWYFLQIETLESNVRTPSGSRRPVTPGSAIDWSAVGDDDMEHLRPPNLPEFESDITELERGQQERERGQQELDRSDWYQDDYRDPREDYEFAESFYERVSTNDAYW